MPPTRVLESPDAARWQARILGRSVVSDGGCRVWTGSVDRDGYGRFPFYVNGERRFTGAHRAAWLAWHGPIVGDLVIDHLCRNPRCVNVAHLDLVTNRVNTLRGDHSGKRGRSGKRKDAPLHSCARHGRDDGYLHAMPSGYTAWICRPCARERHARWRARSAAS